MIKIGKKHYNEPGKRETAGYFHVERATAVKNGGIIAVIFGVRVSRKSPMLNLCNNSFMDLSRRRLVD